MRCRTAGESVFSRYAMIGPVRLTWLSSLEFGLDTLAELLAHAEQRDAHPEGCALSRAAMISVEWSC